jgi:spore coat protein A, manganese oxidase
MFSRRRFLKTTMIAGAGVALYGGFSSKRAWAWYQTQSTPLWQTVFRGVGPGGIPVAAPDPFLAPTTGVTHYTLGINQFSDQVHPTLGATTLWGYHPNVALGGGVQGQKHLGGIIVAQKGVPIQLTFRNNLPANHIIPVDTSIDGGQLAQNRATVHLHGGLVPWISDGGPHTWFAPNGDKGPSYVNVLNPGAAVNEAEYYYPMNQSARMLWYHDHALGTTRLNAYAGIASALLLRDGFEGNLRNLGLPDFIEAGGRELPIVVQDKVFVGPDIALADPTWPGSAASGSLWYGHQYDTAIFGKLGPAPAGAPPAISVVPEFFGDTMLANGTVYPEVTVEARRYRLRILNACNARFLNLQMYVDDGSPNGITLNNAGTPLNAPARNTAAPNKPGKPTSNFLVLGTEGGFLPTPATVPSNVPFNGTTAGGSLLVAPAERVDALFDFSAHAGQRIILYTDAPAPFPMGAPINDYFPGLNVNKNPVNGVTPPGSGPNTRVIMRFNVVPATSAEAPLGITRATDLTAGNDPLPVPLGVTALPPGVPVRQLTLNEAFDLHGRLAQLLGTNVPVAGAYGRAYMDASTENVTAGSMEVWQIANLTADTHPIHFHLVNVQVISRQPFSNYRNGVPNLTGAPLPPAADERGWKETVRMNPGEVTTVIMRFDLPSVPFAVPPSPRTGGHEYVWHCHILEHEEHDMMRPLIVS